MFIAYVVLAVVLSLLLLASARGDIVRDPKITDGLKALGVPDSWFVPLGLVKIAGALGLLAGIAYRPLGIAAAIGVVLYFLGAVITHIRAGDKKGIGTPAVIMLVSVAPVALGLATV
ncbi:DoxX family protein [Streptomyces caniscabiei]|uniref:DoxX family protein n=1 Tax=Streptomyces caniscabiei TaxID=2746961 RepID=UPI0023D9B96A|nr:DoxX family protein [Streptomyces caniscabiei]MDX3512775.1 DoxX family protein [Streptomyces caniscabiei]MDX3722300.1 DoxX family protein [Streptomyces caniscabiei]MDX3733401.1 DoxX family protein [Streptomyces caniscabiei]WEO28723.1 DoxX family protein [Streptomyces caniscabiei]